MKIILSCILLFLYLSTSAQEKYSGKRISGIKYLSVNGTYNKYGYGIGIGYDKFLRNDIILNTQLHLEFGQFDYSKFKVFTFSSGLSYSKKLVNNIYLEGRGEAFLGKESENDELNKYSGFTTGLILSPEIDIFVSQKINVSLYYSLYIDIVSKFSNSHECIGLKLCRKI